MRKCLYSPVFLFMSAAVMYDSLITTHTYIGALCFTKLSATCIIHLIQFHGGIPIHYAYNRKELQLEVSVWEQTEPYLYMPSINTMPVQHNQHIPIGSPTAQGNHSSFHHRYRLFSADGCTYRMDTQQACHAIHQKDFSLKP
jgi:hypothetical protein